MCLHKAVAEKTMSSLENRSDLPHNKNNKTYRSTAKTCGTVRNHTKTARRITSQTALQGEQLPLGKQDVRRRLQEEHEEYQQ